ncbi:predicted protein [Uncinocarpus reesii 1704]|uniref:Uncharacterized protein n=1 Tax=Uncinocarpus reesii (strain UAMH 1704) TaxID=336963 RepID=C4JPA8_UNCRE|nr:uncharacterized protein UREG_04490 [Uncinocarpus reesii 1704]EEP79644.1 predicted protein [Uncinocarpus reesii 1704]
MEVLDHSSFDPCISRRVAISGGGWPWCAPGETTTRPAGIPSRLGTQRWRECGGAQGRGPLAELRAHDQQRMRVKRKRQGPGMWRSASQPAGPPHLANRAKRGFCATGGDCLALVPGPPI